MKEIDTRLSKDELWTLGNCIINRAKRTARFIDPLDMQGIIADVGEDNPVKRIIAKHFNSEIHSLDFDFNYPLVPNTKYDTILAFEVLEHTINALTFLESLKDSLRKDGVIYLSIPRVWPQWLRIKHHYHEIPTDRLLWLFDEAGLKVERHAKISQRGDWYHYIFGIRPFLRGFWKTRIYKLTVK